MVVAHVLFARPDELHRVRYFAGQTGSLGRVVREGATPEAAAEILVVQHDVVEVHVQGAGNFGCETQRVLGTRPELANAIVDPRGAVHRFHRRVRQVWNAIFGFDDLRRYCQCRVRITGLEIDDFIAACDGVVHIACELREDVTLLDCFVALLLERDREAFERLQCLPVPVGNDGDCVAEVDHLAHARHVLHR